MKVRNPRTGLYDYEISSHSFDSLKLKVNAMRMAQPKWLAAGIEHRISVLQNWRKALEKSREELVEVLSVDTGRKIESIAEVDFVLTLIDKTCERAKADFQGIEMEVEAYKLVGVISTWHFPLVLAMINTIPALLSGSSVIVKPSEKTPRFIRVIEKTISKVSSLNQILHFTEGTSEVGSTICRLVDLVCFKGSEENARKVYREAAENFIPNFVEFEGKGAAIVLEAADVERASSAILWGGVFNAGQAFEGVERVYVHRNIHSQFLSRLVGKTNLLSLSYQNIDHGQIGPIISEEQAAIINGQLSDAIEKGAIVVAGSSKCVTHKGGIYCRPTILTNVSQDMKIMQEKNFGPILPVKSFLNEEDAIIFANDIKNKYAGAVFSNVEKEAVLLAQKLNCNAVAINDVILANRFQGKETNSNIMTEILLPRIGDFSIKKFLRHKPILISNQSAKNTLWY
jgi:succinate-semialdehyde dehydrogenase / glutarate-semialdehyde dehydrogenase